MGLSHGPMDGPSGPLLIHSSVAQRRAQAFVLKLCTALVACRVVPARRATGVCLARGGTAEQHFTVPDGDGPGASLVTLKQCHEDAPPQTLRA